jgi:hypothetical protein
MSNTLTHWFSKSAIPTRIGVYEVDASVDEPHYSHWNGSNWSYFDNSPEGAIKFRNDGRFHTMMFAWRGLVGEPA